MRAGHHAEKSLGVTNQQQNQEVTILERIDLALASRLVGHRVDGDLIAGAQRAIDGLRRSAPTDGEFLTSVLRLRGFAVDDEDAAAALAGREDRLSPLTQEYRLLRGLQRALKMIRARASQGVPPDGWFLVDLFREMTSEMPRFRNNDLRRGQPWDGLLYVDYPPPEDLRLLVDGFDSKRCYRDAPIVFNGMHPVRQGFRLLWRFARIAPFPDFNVVVAWLGLNAWLQCKGLPLLRAEAADQHLVTTLLTGPPPLKIPALEDRLLAAFKTRPRG